MAARVRGPVMTVGLADLETSPHQKLLQFIAFGDR